MTLPTKAAGEKSGGARHVKSNSRVIPVIPKQLARKTKQQSQSQITEIPQVSSNSSAFSEVESTKSSQPAPSHSSVSSISEPQARGGTQLDKEEFIELPLPEQVSHDKDLGGNTPQPKRVELDKTGIDNVEAQQNGTSELNGHRDVDQAPLAPKQSRGTVELPPPFFPASFSRTAAVTSPSTEEFNNRRSFVFGGHADSSAPSPAPPASADSWSSSGPARDGAVITPASTTVNGFTKPPQSTTPTSNHSFHANGAPIEPTRTHPPPVFVPPPQHFQHGPHPQHQRHWNGNRQVQSPRSGSISSIPPEPPYSAGGPTFPPGQFPNYYNPYNSNDSAVSLQRGMHYPAAPPFSPTRGGTYQDFRAAPAVDPDMPSLYALRSYSMSLFTEQTNTDVVLKILSSNGESVRIGVHSIFLSRSPSFRLLLPENPGDAATREHKQLEFEVPSEAIFGEPNAFHAALRFLYGGAPVRREHLPGNLKSPKHVLEWVLSYAAAGWYLEIPEIASAGLSLAIELMLVDNIDVALAFALKYALSDEQGHTPLQPPRLLYAPYAADFLHSIQRFILFIITTNFEFDRTAPHLPHLQRFPEQISTSNSNGAFTHSSRPSTSNPRLQGLQLGEFQLPTSVNRTLSTVLLSLPFLVLQSIFSDRFLLERLSPDTREGLLRAVVGEREQRRNDAKAVYDRLPVDERERAELAAIKSTLEFLEEVVVAEGEPRIVGRVLREDETNGSGS